MLLCMWCMSGTLNMLFKCCLSCSPSSPSTPFDSNRARGKLLPASLWHLELEVTFWGGKLRLAILKGISAYIKLAVLRLHYCALRQSNIFFSPCLKVTIKLTSFSCLPSLNNEHWTNTNDFSMNKYHLFSYLDIHISLKQYVNELC